MKILVLNGSPRKNGNTAKLADAFRQGAEKAGHQIIVIDICDKDIRGCKACEYCHGKGKGACIQQDGMDDVYEHLKDSDMLVLASPVYYHGISGQLKCAIDRFYAMAYPSKPHHLKKIAIILSSGAENVYEGALYSFREDFLGYLGLENAGIITAAGNITPESAAIKKAYAMGASLP